jgi:hypothetical protein
MILTMMWKHGKVAKRILDVAGDYAEIAVSLAGAAQIFSTLLF